MGNGEPALVENINDERQDKRTGIDPRDTEFYRHMTSREETAKPAKLRTYVDDWRLFKSGNHKAADTLVDSLVTTCHALEDKGMK
eukprot:2790522-Heterocapsa_arctica.AAC.1